MTEKKDFKEIGETKDLTGGDIVQTAISSEMKKAYLDYAMSVIVARALPDVRDGLKPVQRRIIYAAHTTGLSADSRYRKSAELVGEVIGKYHPHGDQSIYDALVRMAQPFTLRYPVIDGQGNFGSIDGDSAAAMRYTECRMERISDFITKDIDKNTVEFVDTYSAERKEPVLLPAVIPNLLMNGSTGIAVGMATNIPPHNLSEIIDAISMVIEKGELEEVSRKTQTIKAYDLIETPAEVTDWQIVNPLTVEEIADVIKGPDFPTGCTIYDRSETIRYFATGRGKIIQRAKAVIEEGKSGRFNIVITEIPYQVNKSTLVEKIASLVNNKKIKEIADIKDLSQGESINISVELKRDSNPQKVLNYLYKYTPLQTAFNANMLALVDNEPKVLGIKSFLDEYLKHRKVVITNRTLYLLKKAREREHILEGLKKALDFIDEVIDLIRKSKDSDEAKAKLIKRFEFTEIQAQAILDMQLRRLAALEREKIENELKDIQKNIATYLKILSTPAEMTKLIKDEMAEIKAKFSDKRKTKVIKGKIGEFSEEDLVTNEPTLISVTASGYIKRMKPSTYKTQIRGGKGVVGMKTKAEDEVVMLRTAETHDRILFLSSLGRIFEKRVWDIPEGSRQSKGTAIVNLVEMNSNEKLKEVITLTKDDVEGKELFLLTATKHGNVKKTALSDFENIRKSGIIAMGLKDGDQLVRAKITEGSNDVILVTRKGKSIRFKESDVRPMGRSASGVRGIKLRDEDHVVSMEVISSKNEKDERLLTIMENGYGKATHVSGYSMQKRGGTGVKASNITKKTGEIVAVKLLTDETQDILMTSEKGQIIRMSADSVPTLGRDTQGVILMRLTGDDKVSAVSIFEKEESE